MPLDTILRAMDAPVKPEVIKDIVRYMKSMPADREELVLQCAEHLDKDQSLRSVLAVAHALNEGEFLLKCRDDDLLSEHDALTREFDSLMMGSSGSGTSTAAAASGGAEENAGGK